MSVNRGGIIVDISNDQTKELLDKYRRGIVINGEPLRRGQAAARILLAESRRQRQLTKSRWPRRRATIRSFLQRQVY